MKTMAAIRARAARRRRWAALLILLMAVALVVAFLVACCGGKATASALPTDGNHPDYDGMTTEDEYTVQTLRGGTEAVDRASGISMCGAYYRARQARHRSKR
jgi:hypothetical protein